MIGARHHRFPRGRAAVARLAHNQEVAGSNPAPATNPSRGYMGLGLSAALRTSAARARVIAWQNDESRPVVTAGETAPQFSSAEDSTSPRLPAFGAPAHGSVFDFAHTAVSRGGVDGHAAGRERRGVTCRLRPASGISLTAAAPAGIKPGPREAFHSYPERARRQARHIGGGCAGEAAFPIPSLQPRAALRRPNKET